MKTAQESKQRPESGEAPDARKVIAVESRLRSRGWGLNSFQATRKRLAYVARRLVTQSSQLKREEINSLRAATYTLSVVAELLKSEHGSRLEERIAALEARLFEEPAVPLGPRRMS